MIDQSITQPLTNPTAEPSPANPTVGFCQHCGKPLNAETIRKVGSGVFCEPCLADRLAGVPSGPATATPPPTDPARGWSNVHGSGWSSGPGTGWTSASGFSSAPTSGSRVSSGPDPNLAFFLGLMPGVGAMYNEQYDKGLVHLAIFAFLVILSHLSFVFGIFIAGWIFYMAIEAHHTARARRDGLPLPNPFGFNDIGERLGFGRNWTVGVHFPGNRTGFSANPVPPPTGTQPPSSWGAPPDSYQAPPTTYAQTQTHIPYAQTPYTQTAYGPGTSAPPYTPVDAGMGPGMNTGFVPPAGPMPARFPVGALWLIGLGVLFLLSTTGLSHVFSGSLLIGLGLAGFGAYNFTRRYLDYGPAPGAFESHDDHMLRLIRALRGSIWIMLVGLMMILNGARILTWGRSWPLFLIASGVLRLMERSFYSSRVNQQAGPAYTAPTQPVTPPQPAPRPTYGDWNPPPADPYAPVAQTGNQPGNQPNQGGR
jgi:hypothetical protein